MDSSGIGAVKIGKLMVSARSIGLLGEVWRMIQSLWKVRSRITVSRKKVGNQVRKDNSFSFRVGEPRGTPCTRPARPSAAQGPCPGVVRRGLPDCRESREFCLVVSAAATTTVCGSACSSVHLVEDDVDQEGEPGPSGAATALRGPKSLLAVASKPQTHDQIG